MAYPKIAFFGSSLVSAYWNGAATYYRGMIRSLAQLGCQVTFYEPDAFDRQNHRDIDDPPWARSVVYPADEQGLARVLEDAWYADVVIKASGVGVFDDVLEAAVVGMMRPDAVTIFWDVDAPATLERLHNDPNDPFHSLVPRYDMVLTYGGGPPVVSEYRRLGARECVPVYNGLDTETHFRVKPNSKFAGDLSFLGNRLQDREERFEEFMLRPAAALSNRKFILGGNGWADKNMPPNVEYVGHVYTRDHNVFNSSTLAVLNVNRAGRAKNGYSPAARVFEAAGAGACIVTDQWEGIEMFFEPDTEIIVARDGEAVVDILGSLTPQQARKIGQAAFRRACAEHTYQRRAALVHSLIENGHTASREASYSTA